ncbi:MAG TPA: alginate lyase family protein [Candidatus Limnocylindrales bacterium]|nr:alginate lyase family protein [Candidatus Limnocylindrales bacterium]
MTVRNGAQGASAVSPDSTAGPPRPSGPRRLVAFYRRLLVLLLVAGAGVALLGPGSRPSPDGTALAAGPLLVSRSAISRLPTSGAAWSQVKDWADASPGKPDIADQNDDTELHALARALVWARTGTESYRTGAVSLIKAAIGSEVGGRSLALARNLPAYVIAADVVGLSSAAPDLDANQFRPWLRKLLTEPMSDGDSLVTIHERRPNNWGTHAGAARVAIAGYLGDSNELARAAAVFRGWLGDRTAYAGFSWGDLSWQCDSSKPVGINPKGCAKSGMNIDGVLPDDMRRGGSFPRVGSDGTGYSWEALQGALLEAELLSVHGYDTWHWSDDALARAVRFLYRQVDAPAEGDDEWEAWLVDGEYGTAYHASAPAHVGKNFGFTDWLFGPTSGSSGSASSDPTPTPKATPKPTSTAKSTSTPKPTATPGPNPSSTPAPDPSGSVEPEARAPSPALVSNAHIGRSRVPIRLSWGVRSTSAGVGRYQLAMSVDGASWTGVDLASASATSLRLRVSPKHTYRFRVRVQDQSGRWSVYAYGSTFRPIRRQESAATYTDSWVRASYDSYLAHRVEATRHSGGRVTFSFTGRSVAWVGPKGPTRGRATVSLDGRQIATVDLYAPDFIARRVLVAISTSQGTHRLTIDAAGTAGRPWVAVDAFLVLDRS